MREEQAATRRPTPTADCHVENKAHHIIDAGCSAAPAFSFAPTLLSFPPASFSISHEYMTTYNTRYFVSHI